MSQAKKNCKKRNDYFVKMHNKYLDICKSYVVSVYSESCFVNDGEILNEMIILIILEEVPAFSQFQTL